MVAEIKAEVESLLVIETSGSAIWSSKVGETDEMRGVLAFGD